jgi:hypothetical protein
MMTIDVLTFRQLRDSCRLSFFKLYYKYLATYMKSYGGFFHIQSGLGYKL